ncbi:transposase [Fragilaria crotonensis]|nr:transposase [Fragilaria crotonensis]
MDPANSFVDAEHDVVLGGGQQRAVAPGAVVHDAGNGLGVVMMETDEEGGEGSSNTSSSSSSIVLLGVKKKGRVQRHRSTSSDEGEEHDHSSARAGDEDGKRVALLASTNTTGGRQAAGTDVTVGGRAINECWKYLSTMDGQHLVIEMKCMKCGTMVRHHRKSEKVKAHLNRCRPFLNSLRVAGLFDADIPHWVILKNDGRKKNDKVLQISKNMLLASPDTTSTPGASTAYTTATAATRTPSTTTASKKPSGATRTMHDYLIPPLTPINQAAFQEEIAMYFYMCAMPFSRMEEPHLLRSLQKLRPDVKLPSRKDLSGRLLQSVHKKVKSKVDAWLKRDHFACVISDAWSNIRNESVINYMLVSGDISFFLGVHSEWRAIPYLRILGR